MSKSATRFRPAHEVGGVGETARVRHVLRLPLGRVAAQRDDVADALVPIAARNGQHLVLAGTDAGQVRRTGEPGLARDAGDDVVGAVARGAVGAIGHRHEPRPQRREPLHRLPQRRLHLRRLRRKELERHLHRSRGLAWGWSALWEGRKPRFFLVTHLRVPSSAAMPALPISTRTPSVRPGNHAGGPDFRPSPRNITVSWFSNNARRPRCAGRRAPPARCDR